MNRKSPDVETFTCLLTNRKEINALLEGVTLANFSVRNEIATAPHKTSNAAFVPEKIRLSQLSIGQRLRGRVHRTDRTGVTLDLGLPFYQFLSKVDFNKVSAPVNAILEVEITQINQAANLVVLKAVANLSYSVEELCLPSVSQKMTCSLCGVQFANRDEQVSHYKLDWHRYNLKQRIFGKESVTETAFNEMAEAISSLSGSESDGDMVANESSESSSDTNSPKRKIPLPNPVLRNRHRSASVTSTDDTEGESESNSAGARVHTKIFLRNGIGNVLSFYRCLLHNKENVPESPEMLMSLVRSLSERTNWAIILIGGGHFAAAVFHGSEVVSHKTFHRYTVRAKQGGAQCTRDARGGSSKSAGASLRRYNEACIIKDVQDCLGSWAKVLSECQAIFYRAPSFNRATLFGKKNPPFTKDDPRLRIIPFPTRRATFREVQRVHNVLATLECHGKESQFEMNLANPCKSPTKKPKPKGLAIAIPTKDELDSTNCHLEPKDVENVEVESEDAGTIELITMEETILTCELQEFGFKGPVRRKKRRPKGTKRQQDPGTPIGEENERYQLKNALYSACSSGNIEKIEECLSKLVNIVPNPNETRPVPSFDLTCPNRLKVVPHVEVFPSPTDSEVEFPVGVLTFSGVALPMNHCKVESPLQTKEEILNEILNEPLGNFGGALLHVAAKEGHKDVVRTLLELGADPTLKNKLGHTPYVLAGDKETRKEFRLFWGANPERYDYARTQIPGPLTVETEQVQLEKAAEKRREKKRVQRDKENERKTVEKAEKKEKEEKSRFLALSDREKRAFAAEKRILSSPTKTTTILSRCFECGADISGQVPFEYNQNRFCTTKCVQVHRKKAASLS